MRGSLGASNADLPQAISITGARRHGAARQHAKRISVSRIRVSLTHSGNLAFAEVKHKQGFPFLSFRLNQHPPRACDCP